jgi:uncharacterized membrane protein
MALTFQPFSEIPEVNTLREELKMNVPDVERIASATVGLAMVMAATKRRGPWQWALLLGGGWLVQRGWTGRCAYYAGRLIDRRHESSGVPGKRGVRVERSIEIRRSPEVLYGFWRDLDSLPKVMRHVESVQRLSERRSRWKVHGPLRQSVEWDAEIVNEEPGRLIAWQSLPGSPVRNSGSVWFEPTASGGTTVKVAFAFDPPAGALGAWGAKMLGCSPDEDLAEDLARLKEFAERELAPFAA